MTKLLYSLIDQLACELVHLEKTVEVRHEYEPRGLPKRQCLGFITDDPLRFMFNFGRTIASDNVDPAIHEAFHDTVVRRDQMGRDQIVYFPDVQTEWLE
jgi:hypothetical protein